jgi:hypothetical protein
VAQSTSVSNGQGHFPLHSVAEQRGCCAGRLPGQRDVLPNIVSDYASQMQYCGGQHRCESGPGGVQPRRHCVCRARRGDEPRRKHGQLCRFSRALSDMTTMFLTTTFTHARARARAHTHTPTTGRPGTRNFCGCGFGSKTNTDVLKRITRCGFRHAVLDHYVCSSWTFGDDSW